MQFTLTDGQREQQSAFFTFVQSEIAPYADQWDRAALTPRSVIEQLARTGYLGALAAPKWGGLGMEMVTFGLLNEELGRGCSSIRSLLTVHSMVLLVVQRWGKQETQQRILPGLASGSLLGAFALSEPNAGSDVASIETTATPTGDGYLLNGQKKWITYGQYADVFLVFAMSEGRRSCAFLVEKETSGLTILPINDMVGMRASMLAELHFQDCFVPLTHLVGGRGFGLPAVAPAALDIGRYSVACGSIGLAQACLDATLAYTSRRQQFGVPLKEHQLIQQMVTRMLVNTQAARLLCYRAGALKERRDPRTVMETWMAKYSASIAAVQAANDAVQIHGANGYSGQYPVQRYLRDAKVLEIIEGSTQLQEITIAELAYRRF